MQVDLCRPVERERQHTLLHKRLSAVAAERLSAGVFLLFLIIHFARLFIHAAELKTRLRAVRRSNPRRHPSLKGLNTRFLIVVGYKIIEIIECVKLAGVISFESSGA